MLRIFLLFIAFLFSVSAGNCQTSKIYMFSFFINNGEDGLHLAYSRDGYNWKALKNSQSFLTPAVANDKLMRDPCIIKGPDNLFHMVWTVSWKDRGIGYASSADLKNWSEQKIIPVMKNEPEARNCWAPEIFYDDVQKLYMIYWATTIPGRFKEGESQGDNNYNHRLYYTTTTDFITFSDTKLLYDEGFNVIDATIKKIDGQYYMFLKDETKVPPKKHILIARSETLTGGYRLISGPITPDWVEGPTVANVDGYRIVYYDEYTRHRIGAVRSKDLQNWQIITDSIHFPEGTRHGTVFQVDENILDNLLKE